MSTVSHVTPQNNFDLLRLVAAVFVIITHSYALLGLPENDLLYSLSSHTFSFSRLGVWIFFCISGYLITASVLRSPTFLSYIRKRALRILPAFIAVVLFSVCILGPLVTTESLSSYVHSATTWNYLKTLLVFRIQYPLPGVFEQNPHPSAVNGSLWTIPYEVTCYALIAITLWFVKRKKILTKVTALGLWLTLFFVQLFYTPYLNQHTIPLLHLNAWHLVNFSLFFFGGALMYLFGSRISYSRTISLSILCLWIASLYTPFGKIGSYIALPYLVIWCANLPCFFRFRPKKDISYGLYLYAFPIQQLIVFLFLPHVSVWSLAVITTLSTIPLASLSATYIEIPALRFKKAIVKT